VEKCCSNDNEREFQKVKDKIGITASCFDLLHAGHISMLREAKSYCDHLICCIQTDPTVDRPSKNKPIQSIVERHIQLAAIKYVDEIIPYTTENDLVDILNMLDIDIRFIGEDYIGKRFTGDDIKTHELFYNKRTHKFSTSELRCRVKNDRPD
jgi:glycerol-3-phosphate cytidylyltransferase